MPIPAKTVVGAAALAVAAALAISPLIGHAESATALPRPAVDAPLTKGSLQTAVLSGGCFWGVQGVFQHVKGVKKVYSGYAGGAAGTAQYETVSTGSTGHAESVQITYDPSQVSYGELLRVYFSVAHNPTELNYQGPDHGTQYRSNIWYMNDEQKRIAAAYIAQLDKAHAFPRKIVTRVDPYKGFYRAEGYHQDYLIHNPTNPYIVINDLPKIADLKRVLPEDYRGTPVMVTPAS